jgi:hypothetical protein
MADHVAYIHTRMPGPVKVVVCSCGWESNPNATAIGAIQERTAHYDRERLRAATAPDAAREGSRE